MLQIELVVCVLFVTLKEIDLFAVCKGPGNFTGLRVSIGFLKGIVYPLNKPLVGISSLDALALSRADLTTSTGDFVDSSS